MIISLRSRSLDVRLGAAKEIITKNLPKGFEVKTDVLERKNGTTLRFGRLGIVSGTEVVLVVEVLPFLFGKPVVRYQKDNIDSEYLGMRIAKAIKQAGNYLFNPNLEPAEQLRLINQLQVVVGDNGRITWYEL